MVLGNGAYVYEAVPEWGRLPSGVKFGYTHGFRSIPRTASSYVNQSKRSSVIFFDDQGRYIKSWERELQTGAHGCLLWKEGGTEYLYLSDYARHVVVKTTLDGEIIWTLGWPEESGLYKDESEFKPTNVALSPRGDIYMADGYGLSYVYQYNSKLQLIRSWGEKGAVPDSWIFLTESGWTCVLRRRS